MKLQSENLLLLIRSVTTRAVFLYRVLLGIAGYTEQNIAIRSSLSGVEYFCYSKQVIRSRIFEYFCYSEQVIRSKIFFLFRADMRSKTFLLLRSSRKELIFEKDLRAATLLRKRLWRRCFPENFVKFLKTRFLTKHLWWLLLAIPCRLYRVEHFCPSEQVIPSRRFALFRVGYIWSRTIALCYSEQVILIRTFLIFQVGYTKKVHTEQKVSAILCSLNQSEHFDDPKKVIQSRNLLLSFLLV